MSNNEVGIKHNTHADGQIQSLGYKTESGSDATVGVILGEGRFDFGIAERTEIITVIDGTIYNVHGEKFDGDTDDNAFTISKGSPIIFHTFGPAAYHCLYSNE